MRRKRRETDKRQGDGSRKGSTVAKYCSFSRQDKRSVTSQAGVKVEQGHDHRYWTIGA